MKKRGSKMITSKSSKKLLYALSAKMTSLSPKQLKDFVALLRTLRGDVDHLVVVDGVFRASTNSHYFIIETIIPFFRNLDFVIEINENTLKKLSVLNKKSNIKVKLVGQELILQDGIVYQVHKLVLPSNANNKFISSQELEERFHNLFRYSDLILKAVISKKVIIKSRVFAKQLQTNILKFNHENGFLESAILRMDRPQPLAGEPIEGVSKLEGSFISPIKENHYIAMSTDLLLLTKENITVNLFASDNEDVFCAICNTNVGDLTINIYGKCKLLKKD